MKMIQLRFLSLFIFTLSLFSAHGQVASFIRYSVENGMAQSQVQCTVQDDYGRIWIGTINGLSMYDGVKFENFSKKDGLAEDWITTSFKDSQGNLWFGHLGGSISKYDVEAHEFENVQIEAYNEFLTITSFLGLDSTRFLFTSSGSGLFMYNISNRKVTKLEFAANEKSKFITCSYRDQNNNLWFGTENDGLYVFPASEIESENLVAENISDIEGLSSNKISDLVEFHNELWIGTKDGGINLIDIKEANDLVSKAASAISVTQLNEQYSETICERVNCMLVDHKGELWVGTNNKGIEKFEYVDGTLFSQIYSVAQGLSFYSINSLFLDRESTIWIGTNVGLNQFISDYFLLYDESVGIVNNMIWSLVPDGKGNIWLGTNNGIAILENADSKINDDEITVQNLDIEGLNTAVNAMYKDGAGNIWMATTGGSLFKRTPAGDYERIAIERVFKDVIFSIAEDNSGNIWIGTRAGAARLNKSTNNLKFFSFENGLEINNIRRITSDKSGNVWFGGLGGIVKYDGEKFEKLMVMGDGDESLVVISITEDLEGNIWFGGYSVGLFKYDGDSISQYTKADGLTSETPYALIADEENNIWIGTSFGVEKFDSESGRFIHFSRSEGFLGVEVNPNSICRDDNDNIWFGSILGAVKYNPNSENFNENPPIVRIPGLQINNEESDFPFKGEFSPEQNSLTFEFIGVSLNNSNKVRYEYKLEGLETEWKETDARQAFYSNLDPGNYSFLVRAYNNDDVVSEATAYDFNIKVPFYDSYWFYGIQVVIIILMLTLAVFYGRKTGGSRVATVLASIAIIIVFEYGVNYVEDNVENVIGGVAFIKVALNALLGFVLFPVENFIKKIIVKQDNDNGGNTKQVEAEPAE